MSIRALEAQSFRRMSSTSPTRVGELADQVVNGALIQTDVGDAKAGTIAAMAVEVSPHLFTADDYEAMVAAGVLGRGDRVELIEGVILDMTPMGAPHAACVRRLTTRFVMAVVDRAVVSPQCPLRLSDLTEPEPDLALLRPPPERYDLRHPTSEDVLLLVEVSDTSLQRDREVKLPLYARAGIPETWIIDVEGGALERYWDPQPNGYQSSNRLGVDEVISPGAFPGMDLRVGEILVQL